VYTPLLLSVTISITYSARNTALVVVSSIVVILVEFITVGSLSFCQMNTSGGEFCEVQNNMRVDPTSTVSADDENVVFITGAAVKET